MFGDIQIAGVPHTGHTQMPRLQSHTPGDTALYHTESDTIRVCIESKGRNALLVAQCKAELLGLGSPRAGSTTAARPVTSFEVIAPLQAVVDSSDSSLWYGARVRFRQYVWHEVTMKCSDEESVSIEPHDCLILSYLGRLEHSPREIARVGGSQCMSDL